MQTASVLAAAFLCAALTAHAAPPLAAPDQAPRLMLEIGQAADKLLASSALMSQSRPAPEFPAALATLDAKLQALQLSAPFSGESGRALRGQAAALRDASRRLLTAQERAPRPADGPALSPGVKALADAVNAFLAQSDAGLSRAPGASPWNAPAADKGPALTARNQENFKDLMSAMKGVSPFDGSRAAPALPGPRIPTVLGVPLPFLKAAPVPVGPGSPRAQSREVQRLVNVVRQEQGRYLIKKDGDYGGRTQAAVAEFQKDQGLPDTGIADGGTVARLRSEAARIEALNEERNRESLWRGEGDRVWLLQRRLNAVRALRGERLIGEDAAMGPATEKALAAYRVARGLPAEGALAETLKRLAEEPTSQADGLMDDLLEKPAVARYGTNKTLRVNAIVRRWGDSPSSPLVFISGMAVDADGTLSDDGSPAVFGLSPAQYAARLQEFLPAITRERRGSIGVSQTSMRYAKGGYLNALAVPYCVLPLNFEALTGLDMKMTGSLMAVSYKGKTVYTVVGDRGPRSMIGECAVSVALALGIPANPISGGIPYGVLYTVFPGSAVPAPKDASELKRAIEATAGLVAASGIPLP